MFYYTSKFHMGIIRLKVDLCYCRCREKTAKLCLGEVEPLLSQVREL